MAGWTYDDVRTTNTGPGKIRARVTVRVRGERRRVYRREIIFRVMPTQNFAVKRGRSAQPGKQQRRPDDGDDDDDDEYDDKADDGHHKGQHCYCISGNDMLRPWSTQDLVPLNTIMAWGPNDDF